MLEKHVLMWVKMVQNTPWSDIIAFLKAKGRTQDLDLLDLYITRVIGCADIYELSEEHDAGNNYYLHDRVYQNMLPKVEDTIYTDTAYKLSALFDTVMRDYVAYRNGFIETIRPYDTADERTMYDRHYAGSPKAGVLLHRCNCCQQLFITEDVDAGDTYINNVPLTNGKPICPKCASEIHDLLNGDEMCLIPEFIAKSLDFKSIPMAVHHISVAPPDMDYAGDKLIHDIKYEGSHEDLVIPSDAEEGVEPNE